MKITINSTRCPAILHRPSLRALAALAATRIAPHLPARTPPDLSIAVTDDAGIQDLNRRFFRRDHPTDVISFSFLPVPGALDAPTAEIVVNAQRAIKHPFGSWTPSREFALYVLHGIDHIIDHDDSPADRRRMRRRELRWLRDAHRLGLLDRLLVTPPARTPQAP